jgi:hypothetical protein
MNKATLNQISYIKILADKAGYSEDDYDFDNMSFSEASDTIDDLKDELGYLDDNDD